LFDLRSHFITGISSKAAWDQDPLTVAERGAAGDGALGLSSETAATAENACHVVVLPRK
jgi:hypothetical protein